MSRVMLVFIQNTGKVNKQNNKLGLYYCVCGRFKIISINAVIKKNNVSCGCKKSIDTSLRNYKHGMADKIPEYHIWQAMKDRCYRKKNKQYKDYGGRGITVCDRWLDENSGFINFYNDMGLRPSNKYTLERKDNNKDYFPDNCIWDLRKNQNNNKRNNIYIIYNNEEKTLKQWCEILQLPYTIMRHRIVDLKWDVEKSFTTPRKQSKYPNGVIINNVKHSLKQWALIYNISYATLRNRIYIDGMTPEEALNKPVDHSKYYKRKK